MLKMLILKIFQLIPAIFILKILVLRIFISNVYVLEVFCLGNAYIWASIYSTHAYTRVGTGINSFCIKNTYNNVANIADTCTRKTCTNGACTGAKNACIKSVFVGTAYNSSVYIKNVFLEDTYIKNIFMRAIYAKNTCIKNINAIQYLKIYLQSFQILDIKLLKTRLKIELGVS